MKTHEHDTNDAIANLGCAFDELPDGEAKFRAIVMLLIDFHCEYINPKYHKDALESMSDIILRAVSDDAVTSHFNSKGAMGNA